MFAKTLETPEHAVSAYTTFKERFKDTGQKCLEMGITFTPLVFEAHAGGFSPAVRTLLTKVAERLTAKGGVCAQGHSLRIAERVSSTHQRVSARAILKRLSEETGWADTKPLVLSEAWEPDVN